MASQRRAGQQPPGLRCHALPKRPCGSPAAFPVPLALWPPGRICSNSDSPFQKEEEPFPSRRSIAALQVYLGANSHLPAPCHLMLLWKGP